MSTAGQIRGIPPAAQALLESLSQQRDNSSRSSSRAGTVTWAADDVHREPSSSVVQPAGPAAPAHTGTHLATGGAFSHQHMLVAVRQVMPTVWAWAAHGRRLTGKATSVTRHGGGKSPVAKFPRCPHGHNGPHATRNGQSGYSDSVRGRAAFTAGEIRSVDSGRRLHRPGPDYRGAVPLRALVGQAVLRRLAQTGRLPRRQ